MNYINADNKGIDGYLEMIQSKIEKEDVIELSFEDFTDYIPYYDGEFEVNKESISYLAKKLTEHYLDSEPRIRKGFVKRAIDTPILLYKGDGSLNCKSSIYRNGLLMVRIAVIMAKVDGQTADEEIKAIKKLIWDMGVLSLMEKRALYAKAIYLLSSGQKYDEHARDYVRAALDRETLIEKIPELSSGVANRILEISKEVAVADGFLERSELRFLQDIYSALGLSPRSAKPDLEKYAAEKYMDIKSRDTRDIIPEKDLDEMDDILGDLLLDFDEF